MSTEFENKTHMQHYVEFLYRGAFVDETEAKKIDHRDAEKVHLPKNAYGFRFFSRMECHTSGRLLQGPVEDYSGIYYKDGSVFTAKQAIESFPTEEILLDNIKINKYSHIVKTRFGGFIDFNPRKDQII